MDQIGYIYKITSPTGKIYIGKTTRLNNRISHYRSLNGISQQKLLYRSIVKHGWGNHLFEIIDTCPSHLLSELEIKYISLNNSYHYNNPLGMNLTQGGEGTLGRKDSKETIQKRSQKLIGKTRSESTKQLMSSLKKGKPSYRAGLPLSDEHKQKISQSNKGMLPTNETKVKRNQTRLINMLRDHESILQIDPATNQILKEWKILPVDISKEIGVDDTNIIKCLKKKNNTCKGFIWKYQK
jgi:group I intron endonuclease